MAGKLILKAKEADNRKKKQIYKLKTKDEETVEIYATINSEPERLIMEINVPVEDTEPEPPTDKPPVVEAGDDVEVIQGTTVQLDGTAKDDGEITSISWEAPDGIELTDISEDETNAKFVAPMLLANESFRILQFMLHVEDDKGNHSMDSCLVTVVKEPNVPPVEPPVPPSGDLLYDSNTTGKWKGHDRLITGSNHDPLFPRPFVNGKGGILAASGSNAKFDIKDGVATLSANKGHKRYYIDSSNFSTVTEYELRFNDAICRNHTMQKQSRHNHGGDRENKFGGLNHLTDFENQKCGLKIEVLHGVEHIDAGDDKPLPFKISLGDWVHVRCTDQHLGNREILSRTEYSKDGQDWKLGIEETYRITGDEYAHIFDKDLYLKSSATWYRINPNSDGTKGISIRNIKDRQLEIKV